MIGLPGLPAFSGHASAGSTFGSRVPGRALAAVLLVWLASAAPAMADQCEKERAQHLKSMQATFFNSYYFSEIDDPDRCTNLQSAIFYQQQLVAWLEGCDRRNASKARTDLARLAGISSDRTNCRP